MCKQTSTYIGVVSFDVIVHVPSAGLEGKDRREGECSGRQIAVVDGSHHVGKDHHVATSHHQALPRVPRLVQRFPHTSRVIVQETTVDLGRRKGKDGGRSGEERVGSTGGYIQSLVPPLQ